MRHTVSSRPWEPFGAGLRAQHMGASALDPSLKGQGAYEYSVPCIRITTAARGASGISRCCKAPSDVRSTGSSIIKLMLWQSTNYLSGIICRGDYRGYPPVQKTPRRPVTIQRYHDTSHSLPHSHPHPRSLFHAMAIPWCDPHRLNHHHHHHHAEWRLTGTAQWPQIWGRTFPIIPHAWYIATIAIPSLGLTNEFKVFKSQNPPSLCTIPF